MEDNQEEGESSNSSSSRELLWSEVRAHLQSVHGATSTNHRSWPGVRGISGAPLNAKSQSFCLICQEGGGSLVKCFEPSCNKEFHLDCSFLHEGGMSLEDDGNLTFFCSEHFKPILFCSCRQKYDEGKEMVCCDVCIEWFHCACIGMKGMQDLKDGEYVCKTCTKNNKKVNEAVKAENLLKEERSGCNQRAIKAIWVLVEVTKLVCPLMDQLSGVSSTSSNSNSINKRVRCTPDKLKAAIGFMENPIFFPDEKNSQESDYGEKFGTLDLLCNWLEMLKQLYQTTLGWTLGGRDIIENFVRDFANINIISLSNENFRVVESHHTLICDLEAELPDISSIEIDGIMTAFESIKWLYDYLNCLHHSPLVSEHWLNHLNSIGRSSISNAKIRKLSSLGKDESCVACLPVVQAFAKQIMLISNSLNEWFRDFLLLSRKSGGSLDDLVALQEKSSREFNFDLSKRTNLQSIIDLANRFDSKIQHFLDQKYELVNDNYSRDLLDERNSILICTLRVKAFDKVMQFMLMKNEIDATNASEDRINSDVLQIYLVKLRQFREEINAFDKHSPLSSTQENYTLLKSIVDIIANLESNINSEFADISKVIEAAAEELLVGNYRNLAVTSQLQGLKICSVEERVITFMNSTDDILQDLNSIQNKTKVVSVDDFPALKENIELFLYSGLENLNNPYPIYTSRLDELQNMYNVIVAAADTSIGFWEDLQQFCDDCVNGSYQSPSIEILQDFETKATKSLLSNDACYQDAKSIGEQGQALSSACNEYLGRSSLDFDDSFQIATTLVEKIKKIPIENSLIKKLKRRFQVCFTVKSCQELLKHIPVIVLDQDIAKFKDLHNSLDRLALQALDASETEYINSIHERFLVSHIMHEAQFILRNRLSWGSAGALIESAYKYNIYSILEETCRDFVELVSAFNETEHIRQNIRQTLENFIRIKAESNYIFEETDLKPTLEHLYAAQKWLGKETDAIQNEFKDFNEKEAELKLSHSAYRNSCSNNIDFLVMLADSINILIQIKQSYSQFEQEASSSAHQKTSILARQRSYIVEHNYLAKITQQLQTALGSEDHDVNLLYMLKESLSPYLHLLDGWIESAITFIPTKTSRLKAVSGKNHTVPELELLLIQPIARIVESQHHAKLLDILSEVDDIKAQLVSFLLSSNTVNENKDAMSKVEKQDSNVQDDIQELYIMQERVELVPVEFEESLILDWAVLVFELLDDMQSTLSENTSEKEKRKITLNAAKKKLDEARSLVIDLSPSLVSNLINLDIIGVSSAVRSPDEIVEFSANCHVNFRSFLSSYDYLKECFSNSIEFQSKVQEALLSKSSRHKLNHEKLMADLNELVVEIDPKIKQILEKSAQRLSRKDLNTLSRMSSSSRFKGMVFTSDDKLIDDEMSEESDDNLAEDALSSSDESSVDSTDLGDALSSSRPSKEGASSLASTSKPSLTQKRKQVSKSAPDSFKEPESPDSTNMKKVKKSSKLCLVCTEEEALFDSACCGDICAHKLVSDRLYQELLAYRRFMSQDILARFSPVVSADNVDVSSAVVDSSSSDRKLQSKLADRDNYAMEAASVGDLDAAWFKMIESLGMLTSQQQGATFGYNLPSKLPVGGNSRDAKASNLLLLPKFNVLNLLKSLPRAASILTQETSAAGKTPRNQSSAVTAAGGGGGKVTGNISQVNPDVELRANVRNNFEEVFQSCLQRHLVLGSYALSVVYAFELEEELFVKFSPVSSKTGKREFSRKDYKEKCGALSRNLREKHNAKLVLSLVKNSVTIEKLLDMSSQEFADPALKEARERQMGLLVKDAAKVKTLEEIERDREKGNLDPTKQLQLQQHKKSPADLIASKKFAEPPETRKLDDFLNLNRTSSSSSSDVDDPLMRRSNSSSSSSANGGGKVGSPSSKVATVDVLGLIRSSSKTSSMNEKRKFKANEDFEDDSYNRPPSPETTLSSNNISLTDVPSKNKRSTSSSSSSTSSQFSSTSASRLTDPALSNLPVRLINSEGTNDFEITKPFAIQFKASVTDRRAQGLLTSKLSIEGRVKLEECEKFIMEVSKSGKKVIATCRIFIGNEDHNTEVGHRRFCEEYTSNRRVGVCNINADKSVQFYIVPPQLKDSISVLRSLDGSDMRYTLYGVLISKESGPKEFVNALPEFIEGLVPLSPDHSTLNLDPMDSSNGPSYDASASSLGNMSPDNVNNLNSWKNGSSKRPTSHTSSIPNSQPQYGNPAPSSVPLSSGGVSLGSIGRTNRWMGGQDPATIVGPLLAAPLPLGAPRPLVMGKPPPPPPPPPTNFPTSTQQRPGPAATLQPISSSSSASSFEPRGGMKKSRWGPGDSNDPRSAPPAQNQNQNQVSLAQSLSTPFHSLSSVEQESVIQNKAAFCAANGVQAIDILRFQSDAQTYFPFVFEGHPSYEYFLNWIKSIALK